MLKEEVEEMKAALSCTEEGRARASAHSKHVVSQKAQERFLNSAFIPTGMCGITVTSVSFQRRNPLCPSLFVCFRSHIQVRG